MMKVLGLDSVLPSTDSAPAAIGGGLLSAALDPAAVRERQQHETLLDYVAERAVHFFESNELH